jgi:hypothetical protein
MDTYANQENAFNPTIAVETNVTLILTVDSVSAVLQDHVLTTVMQFHAHPHKSATSDNA